MLIFSYTGEVIKKRKAKAEDIEMRIIESGKHKGKILAHCPKEYIEWAAKHENNFAKRNQWISRDAKILLEKLAKEEEGRQVAASKIARLEQMAADGNFLAAMDLRMAKFSVSQKVTDLSTCGNLNVGKPFSILR
jgi:hypothetical protein